MAFYFERITPSLRHEIDYHHPCGKNSNTNVCLHRRDLSAADVFDFGLAVERPEGLNPLHSVFREKNTGTVSYSFVQSKPCGVVLRELF